MGLNPFAGSRSTCRRDTRIGSRDIRSCTCCMLSTGATNACSLPNLDQPTFDRAIANGVISPFIGVAPDYTTSGPGTMFANSSTAGRFEDLTLQEVIPYIDAHYRTLKAESRAITENTWARWRHAICIPSSGSFRRGLWHASGRHRIRRRTLVPASGLDLVEQRENPGGCTG